ncbi:hypothetical protein HK100_005825, partial [Physocladia obscura]
MGNIKIGLVMLSAAVFVRAQSISAGELTCVNAALESLPACFQTCLTAQGVTLPLTVDSLTAADEALSGNALTTCVEAGCTSAADLSQLETADAALQACLGVIATSPAAAATTTTSTATTSTTTTSAAATTTTSTTASAAVNSVSSSSTTTTTKSSAMAFHMTTNNWAKDIVSVHLNAGRGWQRPGHPFADGPSAVDNAEVSLETCLTSTLPGASSASPFSAASVTATSESGSVPLSAGVSVKLNKLIIIIDLIALYLNGYNSESVLSLDNKTRTTDRDTYRNLKGILSWIVLAGKRIFFGRVFGIKIEIEKPHNMDDWLSFEESNPTAAARAETEQTTKTITELSVQAPPTDPGADSNSNSSASTSTAATVPASTKLADRRAAQNRNSQRTYRARQAARLQLLEVQAAFCAEHHSVSSEQERERKQFKNERAILESKVAMLSAQVAALQTQLNFFQAFQQQQQQQQQQQPLMNLQSQQIFQQQLQNQYPPYDLLESQTSNNMFDRTTVSTGIDLIVSKSNGAILNWNTISTTVATQNHSLAQNWDSKLPQFDTMSPKERKGW